MMAQHKAARRSTPSALRRVWRDHADSHTWDPGVDQLPRHCSHDRSLPVVVVAPALLLLSLLRAAPGRVDEHERRVIVATSRRAGVRCRSGTDAGDSVCCDGCMRAETAAVQSV